MGGWRGLERNFAKKMKETFWGMKGHFLRPRGAKIDSDNILYFVFARFEYVLV